MSEQIQNQEAENIEDINSLIKVRMDKLEGLCNDGEDPFSEVKYERNATSKQIIENLPSFEGKYVSLCGRLMSKRGMGKVSFCDLRDNDGKIQLYTQIDEIGEERYAKYQKLDIGDIVGVKGEAFITKRGEISIRVKEYTLLAKSLRPLPEKFHGLTNQDLRYRMRYLDLIVNPEVKDTFIKRSKAIKAIREYLDNLGYIEVETPVLNTIPGGAAAKPFITHHNTLDLDMYLRIATELHLKRLIVGGIEKVYEIGRIFRNEGMSVKHNPEFTSIELYEAYTDYNGMMDICENMIRNAALAAAGTTVLSYQGVEIDLTPAFTRLTMLEAVLKYASVDFSNITDINEAKNLAKSCGVYVEGNPSVGEILNLVFEEKVEENLIQPTFILDYPVEVSPLTKRKKDNPAFTERFELFITSRELANAYTELNDPIDQKERFLDQLRQRESGNEEANMYDDDFIMSLEYGMPPTGGLGVGIDRLVMLLTDSPSIRDVLLFPTMKPHL